MQNDLTLVKTLKDKRFTNIEIDQIFNYLETLDYDLNNTKYIGNIISKNERLAKYFFLREKLKITINTSNDDFHINEILDQCIDWSEFWRLLVIKKGFCCIRLSGEVLNKERYIFLSGPNILTGPDADLSHAIFDDVIDL